MICAYLFALDPTASQAAAMHSHCGAARVAYNWCLAQVRANWAQRAAEESYGIPEAERTPWIHASAYSLRRAWNAAKAEVAPWWVENSKEAYASGCAQLAVALANRNSGRARMPRFKSKRRSRPSCRFTTGAFGLGADRRHVRLPRIGLVRTCESTRKLARKIDAKGARIRSATLSFRRGRWHVSFCVEVPDVAPTPRDISRVVGVDLGIKVLATLSTGEKVPNPRPLENALRRLRRAQRCCARRQGPDRRTGHEESNRWRKARGRADRLRTRVANLRRDGINRFTTGLVREYAVVAIEDLHVAGMLRNRRLARRIADASWAEIRRQFTYKAERAGVRLVTADRWFASSKTCSGCGAVKAKLALSERTYVCTDCHVVLDRDVNAARNLAALAVAITRELRGEQPDGTDTGPSARAREAVGLPREGSCGTQRHRRETVTAEGALTNAY